MSISLAQVVNFEQALNLLAANPKLGVRSEKAHKINSVVLTITKVADQTNLLSLNAAKKLQLEISVFKVQA